MARFLAHTLVSAAVALAVSCGGSGGAPDAGPPDAGADAAVDGGASSCMPDESISAVPDRVTSTLDGAASMIDVGAQSCAVVDAPFGVEADGPERVVTVAGLTPGTDYAARLLSADDLAFYVGTGCAAAGDTVTECLLFVDASTRSREVGRFTAPASGEAVVVVDHYRVEAPTDGSFALEVYPVQCDDVDDSACTGTTPECVDFRCTECADSFDCTGPGAPVCDEVTNACTAGTDLCTGDDPAESGDDGPAGATDITPPDAQPLVTSASICNAPLGELDYYRFTVSQPGEAYTVELDWQNAAIDLDIEIRDAAGVPYGLSLYERPETIALTYLPAGTYYVVVNYFGQAGIAAAEPYTITATRVTGQSCASIADCAAEHRNQLFRSVCNAGACEYRLGTGALASGVVCDSDPDCTSGTCASFAFTADADARSVCTQGCASDPDCASLGTDYVCTDYLAANECVQKCTIDDQCPVVTSAEPTTGPWFRLRCIPATGKCTF